MTPRNSTKQRPTPMVPRDRLLAELLIRHKDWIVTYHEHDSLLQSETETDLTEEERQAAWAEYENEKEGRANAAFGDTNNPLANDFGKLNLCSILFNNGATETVWMGKPENLPNSCLKY